MSKAISDYLRYMQKIITRRNTVIILLAAIGLALFLSIYEGVQDKDDLALFDVPLMEWAIANQNPTLTSIMRIITDLLSPVALSVGTLLGASLWIWRKKQVRKPVLLVGAMTTAFVLSAIIKMMTARNRPTLTDLLESPGAISYSFPSGHTVGVAVLVFTIGYFYCTAAPTVRRIALWSIVTIASIILVSFSRIYLGYHWFTDVTASVGLAFIVLAAVIAVDTYWPRHAKKPIS